MAKAHASFVKRWSAWSGDIDALKRLARLFESHWSKAGRKPPYESAAVARVEERKWNLQHFGRIDEVLGDETAVLQRARRITFSAPESVIGSTRPREPRDEAEIEFDHGGVQLRVFGEPTWVREVATAVGDEIQAQVPWWAWLRGRGVAATLSYFTLFVILAGAGGRLPSVRETIEHVPGGGLVYWTILFLSGIVILSPLLFLFEGGVRRALPGFELATATRPRRSAGVIAILGAVAASLVAGLLLMLLG